MRIEFDWPALRRTRWYEYPVRFVFGGALTAATGLIAKRYGASFGGLFLAFPAIFPAAVTLVEKHEREKKKSAGIAKTDRGRKAAALDARGATLGTVALAIFAVVAWKLLPVADGAPALLLALAMWLGFALLIWRAGRLRIWLRCRRT
jgi:hypothetical protein